MVYEIKVFTTCPALTIHEYVTSHINTEKLKMTNFERFSKRKNLYTLNEKEITIREDAPEGLRGYVKMAYYDLNKTK